MWLIWVAPGQLKQKKNSALATFHKLQPRVHRIVMDYVQGLKSESRAKMSWQRAGGRQGAENGFHMTATAAAGARYDCLEAASAASCNHTCDAMMKPVESSRHCSIEARPGILRNTNEKTRLRFLLEHKYKYDNVEIQLKRPGYVFSSSPQSRALLLWQVWKTRLHICFSSLRIQDFTNFVPLKNFTNLKVSTHSVVRGCTATINSHLQNIGVCLNLV